MVKNRPALVFLWAFLFLSVCATSAADDDIKAEGGIRRISYEQLLSENQINILKVSPGLTKQEVVEIMGTSQAKVKSAPVTNPFKRDFFSIGKDEYEVIYYLIRRYPPY